jgi:hypothetical protein
MFELPGLSSEKILLLQRRNKVIANPWGSLVCLFPKSSKPLYISKRNKDKKRWKQRLPIPPICPPPILHREGKERHIGSFIGNVCAINKKVLANIMCSARSVWNPQKKKERKEMLIRCRENKGAKGDVRG